jgi:hypothetical protein
MKRPGRSLYAYASDGFEQHPVPSWLVALALVPTFMAAGGAFGAAVVWLYLRLTRG